MLPLDKRKRQSPVLAFIKKKYLLAIQKARDLYTSRKKGTVPNEFETVPKYSFKTVYAPIIGVSPTTPSDTSSFFR